MECEPNITYSSYCFCIDRTVALHAIYGMHTQKICTKKCLETRCMIMHLLVFLLYYYCYLSKRNLLILCVHEQKMGCTYRYIHTQKKRRNNYLGPFRSNKHQSVVVHFIISSFVLCCCWFFFVCVIVQKHRKRDMYLSHDVSYELNCSYIGMAWHGI